MARLGAYDGTKWSQLGNLANNDLKGSRHVGKFETSRDATENEMIEARNITREMIEGYLHYLEKLENDITQ